MKICGGSMTFPLKLIFKSMINEGLFPDDWKMTVVPIHKKESKYLIKNYRPVSFPPIFSKVFERLVFKTFLISFCKTSYSPPASLALYQVIPVFHNYYQLQMKFIKVLIATNPLI